MKDNTDNFYLKIALKLRAEREKRNLTYQQLAERTELSSSSLQRYETGNTKVIPVHVLDTLENFYGLPPGHFMGWKAPEPAPKPKAVLPEYDELYSPVISTPSRLGGSYSFRETPVKKAQPTEFSVIASDDGMLKERIKKGDTVFIDTLGEIKPGDIAAIRIGGRVQLRYAYPGESSWTFASGNTEECPITSHNLKADGIAVLGKAVGFKSKL